MSKQVSITRLGLQAFLHCTLGGFAEEEPKTYLGDNSTVSAAVFETVKGWRLKGQSWKQIGRNLGIDSTNSLQAMLSKRGFRVVKMERFSEEEKLALRELYSRESPRRLAWAEMRRRFPQKVRSNASYMVLAGRLGLADRGHSLRGVRKG